MDDCLEHPPVIPDLFSHIWDWFLDLNALRQGSESLTWSDVKAYIDLHSLTPSKWELDLIIQLDRVWLNVMHSE